MEETRSKLLLRFNPNYAIETQESTYHCIQRRIHKIFDLSIRQAQQFSKHPLHISIDAAYCFLLHNPSFNL